MADNALSMSLDDIIKNQKKNKSSKPARGAKAGFRNNARKQQLPRGKVDRAVRGGRGRGAVNKGQRGAGVKNTYRGAGARGSIRGRNRLSPGQNAKAGKQQFKRINNKLNINTPRNRRGPSKGNSDTPARVVQRAQRFETSTQKPVRYFNQSTTKNGWKRKGNGFTAVQKFSSNREGNVNNLPRVKSKRTLQNLAQKRVQRARLVLTNRGTAGRRQTQEVQGGLRVVERGIRRSKNGFVTVRNQNQKRLERLSIQQKINRATLARNRNRKPNRGRGDTWVGSTTPSPRGRGEQWSESSARGVSSRGRGRGRGRVAVTRNSLVQVRIPNDFGPRFSVQNVDALRPSSSYTLYSNNAPAYGNSNFGMSMNAGVQDNINWGSVHNAGMRSGDIDEFEMTRGSRGSSLDPEIQRKISFIQSRSRSHHGNPATVMPDFKAPVTSSQMKLSDRFRMFMN